MKKTLILASLGLALAMSQAHATAYTYNVSESFGGATMTGTITTDALGSLGAANFTDWNLTLQSGADSVTLLPAYSRVYLDGDLAPTITATASSLTITVADQAALIAAGALDSRFRIGYAGPGATFYNLESGVDGSFYSTEAIRIGTTHYVVGPNNSVTFTAPSSSVVPAPATLPLLAIGGAAMGWRRREAA